MQTVVFLDLDDTLFQTKAKCPPGEAPKPAAYSRTGEPLSFMTEAQQRLLQLFESNTTVIPTTARSFDAYRRVRLTFRSFAILDFGAVVLRPDRTLDPVWDARIRPHSGGYRDRIAAVASEVCEHIEREGFAIRTRIIEDFGLGVYVVLKHRTGDLDELQRVQEWAEADLKPSGFFLHRNHNNLSFVPNYLGKEFAVRYLVEECLDEVRCTLGVGDSFSDAPFMDLCDFCVMPSSAQLWKSVEPFFVPHRRKPSDEPAKLGSYPEEDVVFLLKRVQLEPTPIEEKEKLIQSGRRHYSEMISREALPSQLYLDLFHEALERQGRRCAEDVYRLAVRIAETHPKKVVLVSLARAGIPVGVLVTRTLRELFDREVCHYSISIIRDRGIDEVALRYLLARHEASEIIFVDGWTGKGIIASELERAIGGFNAREGTSLDSGLYVLSDLCGWAKETATTEDYLIPSSILGCTISGLISRSILNDEVVGPNEFHGCIHYEEYAEADLSVWYADKLFAEIREASARGVARVAGRSEEERLDQRRASDSYLARFRESHGVGNINHVKPGVGESTRVLLRRVPHRLYVRERDHPDVSHLLWLADQKSVPVLTDENLPYRALALIKEMS